MVAYREILKYSIVKQEKNDVFLREIIPDAGSGETARTVCNLLNKNHKENSGEEEVGPDEAG